MPEGAAKHTRAVDPYTDQVTARLLHREVDRRDWRYGRFRDRDEARVGRPFRYLIRRRRMHGTVIDDQYLIVAFADITLKRGIEAADSPGQFPGHLVANDNHRQRKMSVHEQPAMPCGGLPAAAKRRKASIRFSRDALARSVRKMS